MYWTQLAQTRLSGRIPNLYVDIDGLAEAVDCFRCCGLTDANDPQVCTASVQLLSFQRKDGSWPTLLYEGPSMLCEVKKKRKARIRCCTPHGSQRNPCGTEILNWRGR